MTLLLAQHAPDFTPSQLYAGLGLLLTALFLVVLSRKVFGHNPPLHKEYISREEHSAFARKMDEELGRERGARKLIHQEIATLQTSVEVVKDQNANQTRALAEIKTEQAAIKREIKEDNQAMHGRIGEVLTGLGEIKGRISKL